MRIAAAARQLQVERNLVARGDCGLRALRGSARSHSGCVLDDAAPRGAGARRGARVAAFPSRRNRWRRRGGRGGLRLWSWIRFGLRLQRGNALPTDLFEPTDSIIYARRQTEAHSPAAARATHRPEPCPQLRQHRPPRLPINYICHQKHHHRPRTSRGCRHNIAELKPTPSLCLCQRSRSVWSASARRATIPPVQLGFL